MSGIAGLVKVPATLFKTDDSVIRNIVQAGIMAPSGGNAQPWKFLYTANRLFVFHEIHFSYSLLDFNNLGSYLAIGAAIENMSIKAATLNISLSANYFPLPQHQSLAAVITLNK